MSKYEKTSRAYRIVAHVHDEVIPEVPRSVSVEKITNTFAITPPWGPAR